MKGDIVVEAGVNRSRAKAVRHGYEAERNETAGERARLSELFAEEVGRRCGVECVLHDERLSSTEAEEELAFMGASREEIKEQVDMYAAAVILREAAAESKDFLTSH